jgi:glycerophosphoryl diester phosphodiesterase
MLDWMRSRPIAHRGLHDAANKTFENTLSAARRAVERRFHIEVDLHPSSDGVPMVFHDFDLKRLIGEEGALRDRTAAQLGKLAIGGSDDHMPTLRQLLDLVAGRVGLVLELKGIASRDDGFVAAVASELKRYDGPVAIMSFDHWLLTDARRDAPGLALGLTAEGDDEIYEDHWRIAREANVDFVSYGIRDLPCRFVREFRESGKPVITWTVRSPDDAKKSALYADQITFESFDPDRG